MLRKKCYLAMNENYGSKESPGTSLAIHMEHTEYLQKSNAAYGRGRENLSVTAYG